MSCYDRMLGPSLRIVDPAGMHLTNTVSPAPMSSLRRGGRA
jgi:hypothetical protein